MMLSCSYLVSGIMMDVVFASRPPITAVRSRLHGSMRQGPTALGIVMSRTPDARPPAIRRSGGAQAPHRWCVIHATPSGHIARKLGCQIVTRGTLAASPFRMLENPGMPYAIKMRTGRSAQVIEFAGVESISMGNYDESGFNRAGCTVIPSEVMAHRLSPSNEVSARCMGL